MYVCTRVIYFDNLDTFDHRDTMLSTLMIKQNRVNLKAIDMPSYYATALAFGRPMIAFYHNDGFVKNPGKTIAVALVLL